MFGQTALVFPNAEGNALDSRNFAQRDFARVGPRRLWPHPPRHAPDLRHIRVSRHLAAGTPLKWIQERGGWTTAKVLLDVYGHFMPTELRGFADAIASPRITEQAPQNAPRRTLAFERSQRTGAPRLLSR